MLPTLAKISTYFGGVATTKLTKMPQTLHTRIWPDSGRRPGVCMKLLQPLDEVFRT